ncbi:MAG: response regulator [Deltaproteobacteria bacterium]|nr:response regulator [Deltaproteobacteria bacterium]
MDTEKVIMGKKVLIVDDEKDILELLTELLDLCKIDAAATFDEAKGFLETYDYDVAILDIQGVKGFELLELANQRGIPALMLTAHALTADNLKKSAEKGASYYAPKDEINDIAIFVADVIEAKEKDKNPWVKWFERLGGWFDVVFTGPNWREREKEFWAEHMRER